MAIGHLGGEDEPPLLDTMNREAADIISADSSSAETSGDELRKRFITIAGDISRPETGRDVVVAQTVAAFGRLDIFVSNAGVCQFAEFLEYVGRNT